MDNAWRTCADVGIRGMAANIGEASYDQIPALCHIASEIADEIARREAEREKADEEYLAAPKSQ